MISNLSGSGSVRVHRKKRFLPVRGSGSGSVRLPGIGRAEDWCLDLYSNTTHHSPLIPFAKISWHLIYGSNGMLLVKSLYCIQALSHQTYPSIGLSLIET